MGPLCRQPCFTQRGPCKSWESLFRQCRKQILACEIFSSWHDSKNSANFNSEDVSRVWFKFGKTRCFIYRVKFRFMRSLRDFSCDTAFAVIVSFLKKRYHGFNNIRNGGLKTRFQIVGFWRLWKVVARKHKLSLCDILVHWWVGHFRNRTLHITFQIQFLRWKVCGWAKCIVCKKLCRCIRSQFHCKRFHCWIKLINSFCSNLPRIISSGSSSFVYVGGFLEGIATTSRIFCVNRGLQIFLKCESYFEMRFLSPIFKLWFSKLL